MDDKDWEKFTNRKTWDNFFKTFHEGTPERIIEVSETMDEERKFLTRYFYSIPSNNLRDMSFLMSIVGAMGEIYSGTPIEYFYTSEKVRNHVCKNHNFSTSTFYRRLNRLIDTGVITKRNGNLYTINHMLYWGQHGEIGSLEYLIYAAREKYPGAKCKWFNSDNIVEMAYKDGKKYRVFYNNERLSEYQNGEKYRVAFDDGATYFILSEEIKEE